MFHTLFDSENQNIDFNIKAQQSDLKSRFKYGTENDQYFGKGNHAIDQFNKHNNYIKRMKDLDQNFAKTKTKVKLVVYKNGFILNNGEFRDKSFEENKKFMEQVDRGNIPHELMKKGIMDLGILLINRKSEIYPSPYFQNINSSINNTNTYQNSYQYQSNDSDILSLLYNDSTALIKNNGITWSDPKITSTYNSNSISSQKTYKENSIYSSNIMKADNRDKTQQNTKRNNSQEKEKKMVDFLEFKKEEDSKKDKKEENNEKKKFTAFSGFGQILSDVNIEGLHVDKQANTSANYYSPICHISIRLFNGEIIKAPFNYCQTAGDIYIYVRRVSGSDNFVLLDGFPPRPITDYGRSIGELGLQNTVLTIFLR